MMDKHPALWGPDELPLNHQSLIGIRGFRRLVPWVMATSVALPVSDARGYNLAA